MEIAKDPILPSDGEENLFRRGLTARLMTRVHHVRKDRRTRKKILEDSEFVKFVVDSIINVDDHDKLTPPGEKKEAQRTRGRRYEENMLESRHHFDVDFRFSDSSAVQDSIYGEGTVWDLVPCCKETMYPHQRGGFEFMCKNIAGDITLERLREPLSDSKEDA
ncbi:hypothetical protein HAX54_051752 [Datura stramonium]|uniref:Uncharacterized protein n=1 Tax=Datura stramonium TaxID=4076 RepID=A0ABS8WMV5_DATST|nr:hypothetical protein [Datura stramonium]